MTTRRCTRPTTTRGKDYHAYFKVEVGPHNAGRRKVRISAWMAPTFDIGGDTTYTGMAMDQGNESEIEMGALVPFNFKEIDAPSPSGGRQILFAGVTLFVEWNAMDPHELLVVPTIDMPLAYMQIIPRGSDILCPHRQKTLNDNLHKYKLDQSPIPARPASPPRTPLPKFKPPVRPKRAREGGESVSQ